LKGRGKNGMGDGQLRGKKTQGPSPGTCYIHSISHLVEGKVEEKPC